MEFSTKLFIVLVIAASATATSIGLSAPRIFSQESKGVVTNITRCGNIYKSISAEKHVLKLCCL